MRDARPLKLACCALTVRRQALQHQHSPEYLAFFFVCTAALVWMFFGFCYAPGIAAQPSGVSLSWWISFEQAANTHTHKHTHTHTHTRAHAHAHAHRCVYIYIYIHMYTHTHTRGFCAAIDPESTRTHLRVSRFFRSSPIFKLVACGCMSKRVHAGCNTCRQLAAGCN